MNQKNDSIAVFDSGVGGISVLRQLIRDMPNERFLYFGDSANVPYGIRPVEQILQLSMNAVRTLMAQEIKAIVIACNTATTAAKDALASAFPDLPVVGIQPPIPQAAERFPGGTVGVMATPVTLHSPKILGMMQAYSHACRFIPLPAPGLVDLVEAGKGNSPESEAQLRPLLAPYAGKLDAIILGCTHYPFAVDTLKKLVGEDTPVMDGAPYTSAQMKQRLAEADLLSDGPGHIIIENSAGPDMIPLSWELLNA